MPPLDTKNFIRLAPTSEEIAAQKSRMTGRPLIDLQKLGLIKNQHAWLRSFPEGELLVEDEKIIKESISNLPDKFNTYQEYVQWCKLNGGMFNNIQLFLAFRQKALGDLFPEIKPFHLRCDYAKKTVKSDRVISDHSLHGIVEKTVEVSASYFFDLYQNYIQSNTGEYGTELNPIIVSGKCGVITNKLRNELEVLADLENINEQYFELRTAYPDGGFYQVGYGHSILGVKTQNHFITLDATVAAFKDKPNGQNQDIEVCVFDPIEESQELDESSKVFQYLALRYALPFDIPIKLYGESL